MKRRQSEGHVPVITVWKLDKLGKGVCLQNISLCINEKHRRPSTIGVYTEIYKSNSFSTRLINLCACILYKYRKYELKI